MFIKIIVGINLTVPLLKQIKIIVVKFFWFGFVTELVNNSIKLEFLLLKLQNKSFDYFIHELGVCRPDKKIAND